MPEHISDVLSYHKLYEKLMEFWAKKLSKRIYNLDCELLTVNQESETRQLIEYLGLGWIDLRNFILKIQRELGL